MKALKVIHDKISNHIALLVVGYYPERNELHHFGYTGRHSINKDKWMVGTWKLKQLKK